MSDNTNRVEQHGCIVCGRIHDLLVIYTPTGKIAGCTVISSDGHPVPDAVRPLVACNTHSGEAIKTALARHYPGREQEEDRED